MVKNRITKVKVEEEEKGEKKKLDNEVEHLIAFQRKMQPKFEKNTKKQCMSPLYSNNFQFLSLCSTCFLMHLPSLIAEKGRIGPNIYVPPVLIFKSNGVLIKTTPLSIEPCTSWA